MPPRKNFNKDGDAAANSPVQQQQQSTKPQQQQQQRPPRRDPPPQQQQQSPQQQGDAAAAGNKKEGGKRNDACCVFVGNVAFTTTWQKLKDVMRKAGDVDLVELVVDSTHKPKGSALVSFKNEEDAKTAVQTLNGTQVDGREILVRQYERGARPLVIYGNYTREQLNRVVTKEKQGGFDQPQQQQQPHQQQHQPRGSNYNDRQHHDSPAQHHQQRQPFHNQNQSLPGGDRVSLRPTGQGQGGGQGGRQEWRVHDGGDFNKRNRDTFGDEAVSYRASGNGVPEAAGGQHAGRPNQGGAGGAGGNFGGGGGEQKKLFVSNLPFSCSWKLLKDTFSQVGKVLRADVIMDERGRSRGMGTVLFATKDEAVKAIEEFDGIEMEGRPMSVRLDRDYGAQ